MSKANMLRALLLVAWAAAGCGNDEGDDHMHSDSSDHELEAVPCPEDLPDFVATASEGLEATGKQGLISAKLIDSDWTPPYKGPNDWTVLFRDADGEPLADVVVSKARPFMPAHGHDGGYAPQIMPLDDPGVVQVNNINLKMGGPWTVTFTVSSESVGSDEIVFDVCVED